MLFRQYLDRDPVIAVSYLFGCPTKRIGAVKEAILRLKARDLKWPTKTGG